VLIGYDLNFQPIGKSESQLNDDQELTVFDSDGFEQFGCDNLIYTTKYTKQTKYAKLA